MERFKEICLKILYPRWWVTAISFLGFPGVIWVFASGRETRLIAYPIYVVAFYALVLLCVQVIPKLIAWKKAHPGKEKTITEGSVGLKKKILKTMVVDLIYGAFNLTMGVLQQSAWICNNGLYQLLLGLIHIILLHYENRLMRGAPEQVGWKGYVICGYWLLGLNLIMSGMVFQMIFQGYGKSYPDVVVIAVAAYTFYKLTMAIVRLVQCRKNNSPILGAVANMGHIVALMSLYFLQTAMISAFGQDPDFQKLMNALTGCGVCLLTVLGALGMVLHGRKRLQTLKGERKHGK